MKSNKAFKTGLLGYFLVDNEIYTCRMVSTASETFLTLLLNHGIRVIWQITKFKEKGNEMYMFACLG